MFCAWSLAVTAAAGGPAQSLPDAVASAHGEGIELRVEAYAWRDFMPVSPPGGHPLAVAVRVIGRAPYPVRVTRIWAARAGQVWSGPAETRSSAVADAPGEGVARGGPLWLPGEEIEVVADVRGPEGVHWRLRAPPVRITATH